MGHSSRTGDRTPRCPARRTHGSHRTATVPTIRDPVSRNRPDLLRGLAPAATGNVEDRELAKHARDDERARPYRRQQRRQVGDRRSVYEAYDDSAWAQSPNVSVPETRATRR